MRGVGDIVVTQEPRVEPISLAEAKAHLRITDANPDEDTLLEGYITAARKHAEDILQRPLVLQTLQMTLDAFPARFIRLDRCPIVKFGSVQYRDSNGEYQTLDDSLYQLDLAREPGRLSRAYAAVWPQIRGGEDMNSVLLTWQAGYLIPVTSVNAAGDLLNVDDNPLVDGDKVYVSTGGGTLPSGLNARAPYYVVSASADALALATTAGGDPVDITAPGDGSLFLSKRPMPGPIRQALLLMLGHWNENREDTISGTIIATLPRGVKALLAPYRMRAFA